MPRPMQLTPALVARVPPHCGQSGLLADRDDRPTEAEYAQAAAGLLQDRPHSGEVWVFAYGSLIWNPDVPVAEERMATVHGWHRAFCLGWVTLYRGTPERPGVMLALDRGGACRGVVFRLPPGSETAHVLTLLRREMPIRHPDPPARWLTAQTAQGPVRAIAFPISRRSEMYLSGLTEDQVVHALSTACGERGSMAEYLYNTVRHLEDRGIHDRYLWRLQALVADRLSALA